MKKTDVSPHKQGPSRKVTQATLRSRLRTKMLLTFESHQNKSPRLIMRGTAGGVSGEIDVEAGTKDTVKALAWAHKQQKQWEQMRKRALACFAITLVPENPKFPYGPTRPTGKLRQLLWETTAKFDEIDAHMQPFYRACQEVGLEFLRDSKALWNELCDCVTDAKNGNPATRHLMEKIFEAVLWMGGGRPELQPEEKEAIIASCKKWRPICEELNKAFKELWKLSEYEAAEPYRKEARGRLAENLGIPVEDVQAIEWSLKNPSRKRSKKSTPTQAMCHRVAREFPKRGSKTIENIWRGYLKDNPGEGRKRRLTP